MSNLELLLSSQRAKLKKALDRFAYSYKKVLPLGTDPSDMDDETLEFYFKRLLTEAPKLLALQKSLNT